MWVRGLKLNLMRLAMKPPQSHPMWVRGLKPKASTEWRFITRRTLCGCVD